MSSAPTAQTKPHEPSNLAAFLSYLIPGLGQIYQGRYGKGALFMVSLLGMFMLGQAMGQWQNVYLPNEPRGRSNLVSSLVMRWHYLGQFWIGAAAWPALWHYFNPTEPPREAEDADAQSNFFARYQRMPDEVPLNKFLVNSDKTPDLGWVYTVIAGMLNILVIYDAYAGPMFTPRPSAKDEQLGAKKEGAA
jgi:hypothetical protein